jgi:anthranilate phosphoribosyltransferase
MSAQPSETLSASLALRTCIQKVATGPEYSKDLSYEECLAAMRHVMTRKADEVQTAVFLIGLRMKRETDAENRASLQAILEQTQTATAPVDEVVDVADPYDGYTRGLPASPFLPAVLAACGVPAVTHGVESVGPKYGITHRKVLRAAGVDVDQTPIDAAQRVGRTGWAYVDQKAYCPPMHALVNLRTRIVKRPVLTTVEVMAGPIRGAKKTHLMTGYVHKAYPPIYASLARHAGFDTALIVRGVEGGVIPSLKQQAKIFHYYDGGEEHPWDITPQSLDIVQDTRAVPLPDSLPAAAVEGDDIATAFDVDAAAGRAAELGLAALEGAPGPTYDSLVYGAAIVLAHLKRYESLSAAATAVRKALNSGAAAALMKTK